jgi:hypothetical protein
MKTPIAIALVGLTCLMANAASAYSWQSDKTSVKLRGTLTFTPNEGSKQKPFKCLVVMDLKTKRSLITAVKFPKSPCAHFNDLPWNVDILTQNSGGFTGGSFLSGDGICNTLVTQFQVDGSGIWALPAGQCLSGTMTSKPPVTIVP